MLKSTYVDVENNKKHSQTFDWRQIAVTLELLKLRCCINFEANGHGLIHSAWNVRSWKLAKLDG